MPKTSNSDKERGDADSRKARKKRRRAAEASEDQDNNDPMTECVALCQQQRWREAVLLCRHMAEKARKSGNKQVYTSLATASVKLEYSLRRQMAASLIVAAKQLLAKEFLLDVSE